MWSFVVGYVNKEKAFGWALESTFRPGKRIPWANEDDKSKHESSVEKRDFCFILMFDVTVMICISMYYCPMRAAVAFLHRPKK